MRNIIIIWSNDNDNNENSKFSIRISTLQFLFYTFRLLAFALSLHFRRIDLYTCIRSSLLFKKYKNENKTSASHLTSFILARPFCLSQVESLIKHLHNYCTIFYSLLR